MRVEIFYAAKSYHSVKVTLDGISVIVAGNPNLSIYKVDSQFHETYVTPFDVVCLWGELNGLCALLPVMGKNKTPASLWAMRASYLLRVPRLFLRGCVTLVQLGRDGLRNVGSGDGVEDEVVLRFLVEDYVIAALGVDAEELGQRVHKSRTEVRLLNLKLIGELLLLLLKLLSALLNPVRLALCALHRGKGVVVHLALEVIRILIHGAALLVEVGTHALNLVVHIVVELLRVVVVLQQRVRVDVCYGQFSRVVAASCISLIASGSLARGDDKCGGHGQCADKVFHLTGSEFLKTLYAPAQSRGQGQRLSIT